MARESAITVDRARRLQIREVGDLRGAPIITLHGTPCSRLVFPPHERDAAARGIRLISYDRPGYGGSSRRAGWRTADVADDVRAIADALGLERFAVWGFSGGGGPALACAARLPERLAAAATIGGLAPLDAPGLDWLHGMASENADDFQLLQRDRTEWERVGREQWKARKDDSATEIKAGWSALCSPPDRVALDDELAQALAETIREALRPGPDGWLDDGLAQCAPWGFEVGGIVVPVQIWHGEEDRFVPVDHGRWIGRRIPGAEAHIEAGEGHLSLYVKRIGEIHRWLASKL